jgi:predicted peptidase
VIRLVALALLLAQTVAPARIRNRNFPVSDIGTITYGISAPAAATAAGPPRPLVLALHPGGQRVAYYGSRFLQQVVLSGVSDLEAVVVAPDCPAASWADPSAERAVLALLERVRTEFAIDRQKILVVGYSMGGGGAWYLASRHPELFSGAIVIAGPVGDDPPDRRGLIPTYVIHSRDDQVVPFGPAERMAAGLEKLGKPVKFEALSGLGHGDMPGYIDALRRGAAWISNRWKP